VYPYLDSHSVSSDYVFWQFEEVKVRALLRTTNRGMSAWLDGQWDLATARADDIFDPEVHDAGLVAEIFEDEVGVWPGDYFWQTFLERLAHSVLQNVGARLRNMETESSWRWEESKLFYQHYVGVDIVPPKVEAVLWIRNKLTHLRDELRTDIGRQELAAHVGTLSIDHPATPKEQALGLVEDRPYMSRGVNLTQLQTWRILDVLADQVGVVARAAFSPMFGGPFNPHLAALMAKTPLTIPKFPTSKLIAY
jgi:hypothetical protein